MFLQQFHRPVTDSLCFSPGNMGGSANWYFFFQALFGHLLVENLLPWEECPLVMLSVGAGLTPFVMQWLSAKKVSFIEMLQDFSLVVDKTYWTKSSDRYFIPCTFLANQYLEMMFLDCRTLEENTYLQDESGPISNNLKPERRRIPNRISWQL